MNSANNPDFTKTDREMSATRVFDAPRDLVFQMWTDPDHLTHWWGPIGFSTTTHEMDLRAGGVWRFTMHGPDGRDYKNRIVYLKVERPELLVYKHAGEEGEEPIKFDVTVKFSVEGKGTRVDMRMHFGTPGELNFVIENYGADTGLVQTLARLKEYLAKS